MYYVGLRLSCCLGSSWLEAGLVHPCYLILDVFFVMIIKEYYQLISNSTASDLCGSSEWAAADVEYGDVH